ncbi:cysteine protease StiP family protein [Bacillus sp. 2205SS5-2]|uniref:cysteine protease StiP family protein n=1 Tax=Bacillus sp. 2205SS5-2 TaxID=3109031 RepID=UPI003FA5EC24
MLKVPEMFGSYPKEDVTFLLKDLSSLAIEKETNEREREIQSGTHYSEMLPVEYEPSQPYMELYHSSLQQFKKKVAVASGVVAEQILQRRGKNTVLISLARAGTPIGVLIKRYLQQIHAVELPHYSISIIRDRGIDQNALQYILKRHPMDQWMFIDGWTGKGAITKELTKSIKEFNAYYQTKISDELAVLADPGYCSSLYGTREDFLIPSACLNSTISGLVSRTVLNDKWIGKNDFHGAKYYQELADRDVSNEYVDTISSLFKEVRDEVHQQCRMIQKQDQNPTWEGLASLKKIQKEFSIENINLIKPGVGETTRVLLRRVPWKILVRSKRHPDLEHILFLAKDRDVEVIEYPGMKYECCGIIQPLEKSK